MIILKVQVFDGLLSAPQDIATFVNKNNIKREDIFTIAASMVSESKPRYTIYYYADSEKEEITKGFLGW